MQRILLILLTIGSMAFVSSCDHDSSDSDSSSAYAGVWMIFDDSNDPQLYAVIDSSNGVTDASNFFNDGGSLSVEANGDYTLTLKASGSSDVVLTGNFSSSTEGTLASPITGTISKVTDPGAMAGTLGGDLDRTVDVTETKAIEVTIDSDGVITSATGDLSVTKGRAYLHNGKFLMHLVTTETDDWKELSVLGSGTAASITGIIDLDTSNDNDGSTTLTNPPPVIAPPVHSN